MPNDIVVPHTEFMKLLEDNCVLHAVGDIIHNGRRYPKYKDADGITFFVCSNGYLNISVYRSLTSWGRMSKGLTSRCNKVATEIRNEVISINPRYSNIQVNYKPKPNYVKNGATVVFECRVSSPPNQDLLSVKDYIDAREFNSAFSKIVNSKNLRY